MKLYLEERPKLIYNCGEGNIIDILPLGETKKERILLIYLYIALYWDLTQTKIAEEAERQMYKDGKKGALFCTKWFLSEIAKPYETRTALKKIEKPKEMKTAEELLCHSIFMFLEYRKYLLDDKTLLILGNLYKDINPEFQDEIMISLELLLSLGFSGMDIQEKIPIEKKDQISKQLISEVFSLVPMKLKKTGTDDLNKYPLSKELSKFVSLARNAWIFCREFMEGLLFSLFANTDESKALNIEEFEEAYRLLPFSSKPNYLMGIVISHFLDESEKKSEKADHPLSSLAQHFEVAADLLSDIKKAYSFWNTMLGMISSIHQHQGIKAELYDLFVEANKYLEEKFELMGIKSML
jgi:hypothetical protein